MAGDKYTLDVEAKGAAKFATDLKKAAEATEEFGTAADRVAGQLSQMASEASTELARTATAAEALGTALGPELAGRANLGAVVADLRGMGLTFDEIIGDADKLAAALKQVDAVNLQSLSSGIDTSSTSMGRLRDSSDQSRSVLANLAGNAAQDLGQLGGVAGTAGVAIGQLAEYAADGNIKLSNLAKVAGPMAALTAATLLVTKAMQDAAEVKAFNAEQVKTYTEAIKEGTGFVAAMRKELEETGKLEFKAAEMIGPLADSTWSDDVSDNLVKAGLSLEQFQALIEANNTTEDAWIAKTLEAGVSQEVLADIMFAVGVARENQAAATEKAKNNERLLGEESERTATVLDRSAVATEHKAQAEADAAGVVQRSAKAAELQADAEEQAAAATDRHRDAILALAAEQTAQADAARAAVDAGFAQRDAQRQAAEAAVALTEALAAEDTTMVELGEKIDATSEAALALADADVRVAEEAARAAGVTLTQVDKTDLLNRSLLNQASTLTGPARAALVAHIAQLNGIPPEVASEILALIDQGKVAEAEAKLAETSRTRTAQVNAQANTSQAEGDLNRLARPRDTVINATVRTLGVTYAAGGVAGSRGGIAGEAGPEILDGRYLTTGATYVPPGTHVTSTRQTRTILGRGHLPRYARGTSVLGSTINVSVNAAVVGNRFDVERTVAQAMRRYERRNGARR